MRTGLEIHNKREHHFFRYLLLVVLLVIVALVAWRGYLWYTTGVPLPIDLPVAGASDDVSEADVSSDQVSDHSVPATHPRYISIPSLNVPKTRVFGVGTESNGALAAPSNINDAAWYEKSATPGLGYGAVVINAHNGGYSKDGVFSKLSELTSGDTIRVERGDGKMFTYHVVSNERMTLKQANTAGMKQMMQSIDKNKEGLSLITCAGNYVPKLKQFDHRIMVRAVLESR